MEESGGAVGRRLIGKDGAEGVADDGRQCDCDGGVADGGLWPAFYLSLFASLPLMFFL